MVNRTTEGSFLGVGVVQVAAHPCGSLRADASAAAAMSGLPLRGRSRYITVMMGNTDIAVVGSLVGDPARANILCALLDGRALTATELAYAAGVSPQTTSGHLAKLIDANLITVQPQGRHRYYRLAAPQV